MSEPDLRAAAMRHEATILSLVRREAGALLLRFDTPEDLVQGIYQEVLRSAEGFEWRGEEAFVGWVVQVARRHLSNRRDYWFAHKRNPAALLRLTFTGVGGGPRRAEPADSATGPGTFANRREQMVMAAKALAMLLPRDRDIVAWTTEGVDLDEQARRLGVSRDAAEKARTRAVERLRKAFAILNRGRSVG